jgi:hypothetical protein
LDKESVKTGSCLEIHDLVISKLYAGRKKDIEFFNAAAKLGLVSNNILLNRLTDTKIPEDRKEKIKNLIDREFSI